MLNFKTILQMKDKLQIFIMYVKDKYHNGHMVLHMMLQKYMARKKWVNK